jgi:hypothetical protein
MTQKNLTLSINIVFLVFAIILMSSITEQFVFLGIGFFVCSSLNLLFSLSLKQPKKD